MNQTIGAPSTEGGERKRRVAEIAAQNVAQLQQQIFAIVEPSVEGDRTGLTVQPRSRVSEAHAGGAVSDWWIAVHARRSTQDGIGFRGGDFPIIEIKCPSLEAHDLLSARSA